MSERAEKPRGLAASDLLCIFVWLYKHAAHRVARTILASHRSLSTHTTLDTHAYSAYTRFTLSP